MKACFKARKGKIGDHNRPVKKKMNSLINENSTKKIKDRLSHWTIDKKGKLTDKQWSSEAVGLDTIIEIDRKLQVWGPDDNIMTSVWTCTL